MQRGGLEDRGVHDPLRHQPLHLVQQCLAFAAVAFDSLLLEERVEIRRAAVGIGACASGVKVR